MWFAFLTSIFISPSFTLGVHSLPFNRAISRTSKQKSPSQRDVSWHVTVALI